MLIVEVRKKSFNLFIDYRRLFSLIAKCFQPNTAFAPTFVICWENISAISQTFSAEKTLPGEFFALKNCRK